MQDEERTDRPGWAWTDDAEGGRPGRPARRTLVVAIACLPWLVVLVLVLRPTVMPATAGAAAVPAAGFDPPSPPSTTRPDPEAATPPDLAPTPGDPVVVTVASGGRAAPDIGDAITVAVLTARAWFGGPGPQVPEGQRVPEGPAGYLEHVWVEAVDAPWRGHVAVTLGAIVLQSVGGELIPAPRRLAVPVALDERGARVAGTPYLLPVPTLAQDPLAFAAVDDPEAAVRAVDALQDAGYVVAELTTLARSDGWPWSATFVGAAPDASGEARHRVWLRPHLGGFIVAGWLPLPPPDQTRNDRDPEQEEAP